MTQRSFEAEPSAPNRQDNDSNTLTLWVGGAVMAFLIGGPMVEAVVEHFDNSGSSMACPADANIQQVPECK